MTMELLLNYIADFHTLLNKHGDPRTANWPLMSSPFYTLGICLSYVYTVKVLGPKLMENRKPFQLQKTLIAYNLFQVIFSAWIFYGCLMGGWWNEYSFKCQPVDYSDSPTAIRMTHVAWWYYFSKFTEFMDTIFFVLRKKFGQVTTLHVIHHGIMPMSVWFGVKFTPGETSNQLSNNNYLDNLKTSGVCGSAAGYEATYIYRRITDAQPTINVGVFEHGLCTIIDDIYILLLFVGGHSTFFGLINTFVHIVMYLYYLLAAFGPQMQKYLWWKKYLTTLQMVQFVLITVHAFQLLFIDCDFPRAFAWFIGMHGVMFFFLFKHFYNQTYSTGGSSNKARTLDDHSNSLIAHSDEKNE